MQDRDYTIKRSRRRTISVEISEEADVIVRAPKWVPLYEIERFVEANREWIKKHKAKIEKRNNASQEKMMITQNELAALADLAEAYIPDRVSYFAERLGVTYGKVTVRNQKTLWASCSAKGNLSFNCLLMKVPSDIRDYVIVHELCHRFEMNHSKAFWARVEKELPDYRQSRKWLKNEGSVYIDAVRRLQKTDDNNAKK